MAMLDDVLGAVLNAARGGSASGGQADPLASLLRSLAGSGGQRGGSDLLGAAVAMLQQSGGLDGVLDAFRKSGLGSQADSWVGTGANLGINGEQLNQVLGGSGVLGQLARQLGVSEGAAGSQLAQLLPELVNQLTPRGEVPSGSADLLSQLSRALTSGR